MNNSNLLNVLVIMTVIVALGFVAIVIDSQKPVQEQTSFQPIIEGNVQLVEIKAMNTGFYDKQVVYLKSGVPVKVLFSAEKNSGCGRQMVIPDFGLNEIVNGDEVKEMVFTPTKPGTYVYRCGMNMFRGKFVVS